MSAGSAVAGQPPRDQPSPKTWWSLARSAVSSWIDDYAPSMGAALSYHTVFSLAPLLLIVLSIAGLPATIGDVGAGIALFAAMRFVLPRLLRRL